MGLTNTIKNAVSAAFSALGDLKDSAVYSSITLTGYEPDTGVITNTLHDTTITDLVLVQFQEKEIDGSIIKIGDMRAIFPIDRLTDTPKTEDYITINSDRWNIVKVLTPHRSAIHILAVRKQ